VRLPYSKRRRVSGVYVENLDRLVWVLREKYPRVLEADRRFEEETDVRNKVGTNNLVDALSHIGTFFESAHDLTFQDQRNQVTLFEDHLRRTMMEAWEQMLDFQAGEIEKLWYEDYLETARPMQQSGELSGSPTASHLDSKRKRYVRLLHEGRGFKRGPGWVEWEKGTDKFIEACEVAAELREELEEAIKAAKGAQQQVADRKSAVVRDNLNKILAVIAILIALAFGFGAGKIVGDDSGSSSTVIERVGAKPASSGGSKERSESGSSQSEAAPSGPGQ
jgi:hypothetical protein